MHTEELPVLGSSINNSLQAHTLHCPMTTHTVVYNCSANRLDVVKCQTGYSSCMQMLLTLSNELENMGIATTASVQVTVLQCSQVYKTNDFHLSSHGENNVLSFSVCNSGGKIL